MQMEGRGCTWSGATPREPPPTPSRLLCRRASSGAATGGEDRVLVTAPGKGACDGRYKPGRVPPRRQRPRLDTRRYVQLPTMFKNRLYARTMTAVVLPIGYTPLFFSYPLQRFRNAVMK